MKIYMIGNSFTSIHHLPERLAKELDADVCTNTRGGATLAERLNKETKKGQEFWKTWTHNDFDYLILQDQSLRPYLYPKQFKENVHSFNRLCLEHKTQLVLYETWSYEKDSDYFKHVHFTYEELYKGLKDSYEEAALNEHGLLARVGEEVYEHYDRAFYGPDGKHPSEDGVNRIIKILSHTLIN